MESSVTAAIVTGFFGVLLFTLQATVTRTGRRVSRAHDDLVDQIKAVSTEVKASAADSRAAKDATLNTRMVVLELRQDVADHDERLVAVERRVFPNHR